MDTGVYYTGWDNLTDTPPEVYWTFSNKFTGRNAPTITKVHTMTPLGLIDMFQAKEIG